jgi:tripartite-type tricarboxylate transporter receptor subunit TctC
MTAVASNPSATDSKDPYFQALFADRIGGAQYGKANEIYKFEKIKRAKRKALADYPDRLLLDFGIGEIQEIRAQLDAGKVRLLGVLTDRRLPDFANLATVKEQGFDVVVTKFRGLAGPKGIPDDIAAQWERAIRQVVASDAYKAEYAKESLVPTVMGRAEARAFTQKFAEEITATLRELGVIK